MTPSGVVARQAGAGGASGTRGGGRHVSVVQVGAGLWGQSWAELVARGPGTRLVGLVDGRAEARGWAEAELGTPGFGSLGAALRRVEADAVLLASPPATHRPLAETALSAGLHVLTEKPFALSLEDAAAVVAAGRLNGRIVMVAQNYRFRRQARALQRVVRDGDLGTLEGVRITFRRDLRGRWISPRDWRGRMPHPLLLDMAIHHVDLLRAVTGVDVDVVDARSWPGPDGPFRHHPNVAAVLTLVDGTPVSYEGSWVGPGRETSWNGEWELVGTRARAVWSGGVGDPFRGHVTLERYGRSPVRVALPALTALDRRGVLAELRRALLAGDEPECSGSDNLRSLATVLALARSSEERAPVPIPELSA